MWCRNCNMTTTKKICPVCGNETEEDRPIEIYWCDECKTPVIKEIKDSSKAKCNLCSNTMKYMATDMRPVFPEEILLLELLLEKKPGSLQKSSIWASNHRYFIDGKVTALHMADYYDMDVNKIVEGLKKYKDTITYDYFNNHMENFINANKDRLNYIIDEASEFIRSTSAKYDRESIVISFSGGKDSTVTADLVTKALSDPSLVHIFGNTTLEFPSTIEYANRFDGAVACLKQDLLLVFLIVCMVMSRFLLFMALESLNLLVEANIIALRRIQDQ